MRIHIRMLFVYLFACKREQESILLDFTVLTGDLTDLCTSLSIIDAVWCS